MKSHIQVRQVSWTVMISRVYAEGDGTKHHFSGKRIQRGLYRTSDGTVLNADINGAANILRKAGCDTSSVILTNLLNPEVSAFADLNR